MRSLLALLLLQIVVTKCLRDVDNPELPRVAGELASFEFPSESGAQFTTPTSTFQSTYAIKISIVEPSTFRCDDEVSDTLQTSSVSA